MREKLINGRWNIWTTDAIEEWDGLTGDPVADTGWEACRFRSMQEHVRYGWTFFDIGTEHGALSTVIAREFVGAENMVLMEPSPEFWPNIRKHWDHNGLADPLAFWAGFVSDTDTEPLPSRAVLREWPESADRSRPETGGMAYRSLTDAGETPSITIDTFVECSGFHPRSLNIDVEGAELRVLRGAELTLLESHPYVWVSIHPELLQRDFGSTKRDVLRFMETHGYEAEHLGTDHEEHWFFQEDRGGAF